MRWVRVNRRIGAWAALFALAVQIVLSFGHVHLEEPAFSAPTVASAQAASPGGGPTGPGHHPDADDYCAICATIGLVASSVLPDAVSLGLPAAEPWAWPRTFEIAFASFGSHSFFQARAPPFAA